MPNLKGQHVTLDNADNAVHVQVIQSVTLRLIQFSFDAGKHCMIGLGFLPTDPYCK